MPKLLVCTPTHTLSCGVNFASSAINMEKMFSRSQPPVETRYFFPASFSVPEVRNVAASIALYDSSFDHLLFVDSDVGFRPEAVRRLLDFDAALCGCLYPAREIGQANYYAAAMKARTAEEAWAAGLSFVARDQILSQDGKAEIRSGFVRTRALGMGLTLIKRHVLEALAERHSDLVCRSSDRLRGIGAPEKTFQCFQPAPDATGAFQGEDISFCQRWTATGGEVWACIDERLSHLGPTQYTGSLYEKLRIEAG